MRAAAAVVAGAASVAVLAAGFVPAAAETPPAAGAATTAAVVARGPLTASWCRTLLPPLSGGAAAAESIMRGTVNLGVYGRFRLAANPDWRPQRTLDASGNQQMQALVWAMPLLYTGTAQRRPDMVARFYALLRDWWRDHPYTKPRGRSVDHPIFAGQRATVLLCAAQSSGARDLRQMAAWEAAGLISRFRIGPGTNNTEITAQTAALAVACYVGDRPRKHLARGNVDRLARYLVLDDGSDIEGSPGYARYTHQLLGDARDVVRQCGMGASVINDRMFRTSAFLAHAVRPDFTLETLGDTPRTELRMRQFPPGSPARFAASQGLDGAPPPDTFTTWRGGYVLARNGWLPAAGVAPTFYSIRTGLGPAPTAHTHDDIGAVTYSSRGVGWLGDPGPYRYDSSALRAFVRTRAAHSTVTATPLPPLPAPPTATGTGTATRWTAPRPRPGSRLLRAGREAGTDTTCVRDTTWPTLALVRCVHYSAELDALVVVDRMRAVARTAVVQRWQVAPGVAVTPDADGSVLRSGASRARVQYAGGGAAGLVTASVRGTAAWFTGAYGQRRAGAVLTRSRHLAAGTRETWVTVLAAGSGTPPLVSVTGAEPDTATPVQVTVDRGTGPATVTLGDPPEQA